MSSEKPRIRRSKEESQRLILEAAETLLRQSGPEGVNIRAVAARVGLTDAAVNHHFGTREELLEALLRNAGRRLKAELNGALGKWDASHDDQIERLVEVIGGVYGDGRYAELALRLHLAGWRDAKAGLLNPVVEALHELRERERARGPRSEAVTRFIVGMMHQTLALDPLFGVEFRRSAGMARSDEPPDAAKRKLWAAMFKAILTAEI